MKTIFEMSKEDFLKVPVNEEIYSMQDDGSASDYGYSSPFKSFVIIPTDEIAQSGFMYMRFVLADCDNYPICQIVGNTDVIHIDWMVTLLRPQLWTMDCLPCGYLRLFKMGGGQVKCSAPICDIMIK